MRRAAFTLIELLAVVALLGLAAALVGPRLRGVSDQARLQAATAELTRAWSIARHRATLKHSPMALVLEPGGSRYRIVDLRDLQRAKDWSSLGDVRIALVNGSSNSADQPSVIRVGATGASLPWTVRLAAGQARRSVWCSGGSQPLQHRDGGADPHGNPVAGGSR